MFFIDCGFTSFQEVKSTLKMQKLHKKFDVWKRISFAHFASPSFGPTLTLGPDFFGGPYMEGSMYNNLLAAVSGRWPVWSCKGKWLMGFQPCRAARDQLHRSPHPLFYALRALPFLLRASRSYLPSSRSSLPSTRFALLLFLYALFGMSRK